MTVSESERAHLLVIPERLLDARHIVEHLLATSTRHHATPRRLGIRLHALLLALLLAVLRLLESALQLALLGASRARLLLVSGRRGAKVKLSKLNRLLRLLVLLLLTLWPWRLLARQSR